MLLTQRMLLHNRIPSAGIASITAVASSPSPLYCLLSSRSNLSTFWTATKMSECFSPMTAIPELWTGLTASMCWELSISPPTWHGILSLTNLASAASSRMVEGWCWHARLLCSTVTTAHSTPFSGAAPDLLTLSNASCATQDLSSWSTIGNCFRLDRSIFPLTSSTYRSSWKPWSPIGVTKLTFRSSFWKRKTFHVRYGTKQEK